jgi:hypothetical protein
VKKSIIATVISLAFASTAFAAAPAIDIGAGQAQLGYSYDNMQTNVNGLDLGTYHGNNYQLAYGLSNKVALTGSYLGSDSQSFNVNIPGAYTGDLNDVSFNSTALGLQYKLNDNIAVSTGSIRSELQGNDNSNPTTEMYGGIAYKQNITKNMAAYASYLKSNSVTDWKTGLTYALGSNTSLDVGYHNYQNNGADDLTAKGVGFGVNHKF